MIVYWDLTAIFNFIIDYLLLLGTLRIAGRSIDRPRIAAAALFGALYAVAELFLPLPIPLLALALFILCAIAFYGSGRFMKLTLLYLALSCMFGGLILLLGLIAGDMRQLLHSVFCVQLRWDVFLIGGGIAYLLLCIVFRDSARYGGSDRSLVRVTIMFRGKSVSLTLLHDTGNALRDPYSGEIVPIIHESALRPLFTKDIRARTMQLTSVSAEEVLLSLAKQGEAVFSLLPYQSLGTQHGMLLAFRCDALHIGDEIQRGRLIAISPQRFGNGCFHGLWHSENKRRNPHDNYSAASVCTSE